MDEKNPRLRLSLHWWKCGFRNLNLAVTWLAALDLALLIPCLIFVVLILLCFRNLTSDRGTEVTFLCGCVYALRLAVGIRLLCCNLEFKFMIIIKDMVNLVWSQPSLILVQVFL